MRLTRRAVGLLVVLLALYLMSIQTQVGWLLVLTALLAGLLALSALYPWLTLRSIRLEERLLSAAANRSLLSPGSPSFGRTGLYEGDEVRVELKLTNEGPFDVYLLKVEEDCPLAPPEERRKVTLLPRVRRGSAQRITYETVCWKRGEYVFPPVVVETAAPLGLCRRQLTLSLRTRTLVYPLYYPMKDLAALAEQPLLQVPDPRAGEGIDFYGVRIYRPGDSLKRVHWRATARLGQIVVKEFERPQQSSVGIAFETAWEMGEGKETTMEYSVKIAASVAYLAQRQGYSVRLMLPEVPRRDLSWREVLEYLARAGVVSSAPLGRVLEGGIQADTYVLILPLADDSYIPAFTRLVHSKVPVQAVLLEGFGETPQPGELSSRLAGLGIPAFVCSRGQDLQQALARGWAGPSHGRVTASSSKRDVAQDFPPP